MIRSTATHISAATSEVFGGQLKRPAISLKTPTYWYFVGEADAGTEITVVYGAADTSSSQSNGTVKLTAPALLGDVLYLNVNGSAKQVTRVLLNVNGTAKEALVKANP